MKFQFNDGGRQAAGYKGHTGDCVARAIAIASGRPYQEVYDRLAEGNFSEKRSKYSKGPKTRSAANGIHTTRKWFKDYMKDLGFTWVPTMKIGSGCKVHLHDGELPDGRLVVAVSKHFTCVIDQVVNDVYDPQRQTTWMHEDGHTSTSRRCVYGYYTLSTTNQPPPMERKKFPEPVQVTFIGHDGIKRQGTIEGQNDKGYRIRAENGTLWPNIKEVVESIVRTKF